MQKVFDILKKICYVIGRIIGFIFIIALLPVVAGGLYFAYQDMRADTCRDYLVEKYDFDTFEIWTYKTTIYEYEEDVDCSTLWGKKCTDDKNLAKKVVYYTKSGMKFTVIEYKDGTFEDDYEE